MYDFDVTIGICAFNAENTLKTALDSALSQAFTGKFEILIIDDGSTDLTATIAAEYAFHFPDMVRLIRTANGGIGKARNLVVREAKGRYLTWLDADDKVGPHRLSASFAVASSRTRRRSPPTMAYASFTKNNARVAVKQYLDDPLPHLLRGELCAYLWATMMHIRFYREMNGFNPTLRRCEDQDFFVRFVKRGGRFAYVEGRPQVHYTFTTKDRSGADVEAAYRYMTSQFSEDYGSLPDIAEYKARRLWEISNFYESGRLWEDMWRCRGEALASSFETVFPRLMSAVSREINVKIAGAEARLQQSFDARLSVNNSAQH